MGAWEVAPLEPADEEAPPPAGMGPMGDERQSSAAEDTALAAEDSLTGLLRMQVRLQDRLVARSAHLLELWPSSSHPACQTGALNHRWSNSCPCQLKLRQ